MPPGTSPDPPVGHARELVGRERELAVIEAWLAGRGRGVLLLAGAAGIGKSAVVDTVVRREHARRPLILRCSEVRSQPFGPLLDAVSGPGTDELDRPAWTALHSRLRQVDRARDTVSRLRGLDEEAADVVKAMRQDATAQPSLVVVEDLHWADQATTRLVEYLARYAEELEFPVMVTSRSLTEMVGSPLSSGARRRIELLALGESDSATLASRALGGRVSPGLARDLFAWSGGIPFVLESLVTHALLTGLVRVEDGRWVGEGLPTTTCPADLAAWLLGQQRRISTQTWELLELAALMGDRMTPELLRAAAGGAADGDFLECLEATCLVRLDRDAGQLVFRHALVRAAIDSRIGPDRRRRYHRRIARALEEYEPDQLADRARHMVAAGLVQQAAPIQLSAAGAALRMAAYADVRELLEAALPHLAGVELGTALCRLGLALRQLGDPRAAVNAIRRGVCMLEDAGQEREAGQERLLLGLFLFGVDGPTESGDQYRQAREQLRPWGESEELALSEVWCAASLVVSYRIEAARLDVQRGLDMAIRGRYQSVVAWAYQVLGLIETLSGAMSRGLELLDQSYREALALGSELLAEVALHNGCVARQLGLRAQEAEPLLLAHRSATPGGHWPVMRDGVLLGALVELGDVDRALALAESLHARLTESGAVAMLEWADNARVILLSDAGRVDEARSIIRGGLDGLLTQDIALRAAAQVRYLLVVGDAQGAADAVDEALSRCDGDGVHHRLAVAGAQAYLAAGREASLQALRSSVERDSALRGTAWEDLVAGHAELGSGNDANAHRILARAARRFGTASYQLHYARCVALQGFACGPTAGRLLLDHARRVLAGRHAAGVIAELDALADRFWHQGKPTVKLTAREADVLTLLAAGRTDAEIAHALGISPRTITSHLDRIRDKTGCRRRADLTRLAIERSLAQ